MTAERSSDCWSAEETALATVDSGTAEWPSQLPNDVVVVGLGESTHGTREFWEIRHELLRQLVTERRLRAIGLEVPFSEALALSEYVLHGSGAARTALDEIHYWMYRVDPVLSIVEWLRQFNAGRPLDDRVRVHGIDIGSRQGTDAAATGLCATLGEVLPEVKREFREPLEMLAEGGLTVDDGETFRRRLATTWRVTTALTDRLHDRRETFVSARSRREWEITLHQVRTLRQVANTLEAARNDDTQGLRDQYIEENVSWLLDRSPSSLVAFLAHNGHVTRASRPTAALSAGQILDRRYGDGYYPVAFEFGTGSFTAVSPSGAFETFASDPPAEGTLAATLSELPPRRFVLDFGSHSAASDFDDTQYLRQIGSTFDPEWNWEQYHREVVPERAADGVVYVTSSSPVRSLDDG